MSLPVGVNTFLFADVEESAKLWENNPEAMQEAISRLDTLVAEAVVANQGVLVKNRGEGDSMLLVFANAQEALRASCHFQRLCLQEDWRPETPLKLRMALYTGEAQLRDGDYYGPVVNRCARLRAIGHGGQILVSATTVEAAQGVKLGDLRLRDLGAHRLKDLDSLEQVWQIEHPGLPSEFPRLRSLSQNNLPRQTTNFIGREKEIVAVKQLLTTSRLLTLTGSGGCGKTRLALQVANEVLETQPDGVWLVDLAPLANPSLVARVVAQIMGVQDELGRDIALSLTDALKPKRMLLLLDNCEHLLSACTALADTLLRFCPHVVILASSREALGIMGETTYRVPSLKTPNARALPSLEELKTYEAILLFHDRVRLHKPDLEITAETAVPMAQICQRLDGIPFALELAAARIRSLSLSEIATLLDNRFRLLTGGSRTALPRQQTLRALIDWSYDLLNPQEKTLLCRLAVFAGGWSLEAGEFVCAGEEIEGWEVLDLLTSLVDKSLALYEERESIPHYRLLETVRQYGLDKLMEHGESVAIREKHSEYFLTFTEESSQLLMGPQQSHALQKMEMEHDNIRRAFEWCLGDERGADYSLRFASNLWRFWYMRGYLSEGRVHLAEALAQSGAQDESMGRAATLNGAGALAYSQGDYAEARRLLEEALELWRKLGDRNGMANSLNNLGLVVMEQSDYEGARLLLEEGLEIRREQGDTNGVHTTLNNLGNLAFFLGDYKSSRRLYEESLEIRRRTGDLQSVAHSLYNLGNVAMEQSDYEGARRLLEESLALRREFDDKHRIAYSLNSLAGLAHLQGEASRAWEYLQESLSILQDLGDKKGLAQAYMGLGDISIAQGKAQEAINAYHEGLTLLRELKDKWSASRLLDAYAGVCVSKCAFREAAQLAGAAQSIRDSIRSPRSPSDERNTLRNMTAIQAALEPSDFEEAWSLGLVMSLEQALDLATSAANASEV